MMNIFSNSDCGINVLLQTEETTKITTSYLNIEATRWERNIDANPKSNYLQVIKKQIDIFYNTIIYQISFKIITLALN